MTHLRTRLLAGLLLGLGAFGAQAGITVTPSPSGGTHTVAWDLTAPLGGHLPLLESTNGTTWPVVWSGTASSTQLSGRAPATYSYRMLSCTPFFGDFLCVPWFVSGVFVEGTVVVQPPPAVPSAIRPPAAAAPIP
jgi:hypothetical protein